MKKLTKRQFDQALRKGHGRALMHVKEYGIGDYRDALKKACLTDYTYDHVCEDGRAYWLAHIIYKTKQQEYFWKVVKDNFAKCKNKNDLAQMACLSFYLIQDGAKDLLPVLYENFEATYLKFNDSLAVGSIIIDIDKMEGLEFVFRIIAKHSPNNIETEFSLYKNACKAIGKIKVNRFLKNHFGSHPWIIHFFAEYKKRLSKRYSNPKKPTIQEILNYIDGNLKKSKSYYITIGRNASIEELRIIQNKLKNSTDQKLILRCLQIFEYAELPVLNSFIFDLARSLNIEPKLRRAAFEALANKSSEKVRQFAFKLIRQDPRSIFYGVLELFKKNYKKGDAKFIYKSLFVANHPFLTDRTSLDLIRLFYEINSAELKDCALWVYENAPCTFCRESAVSKLAEWKMLPDTIREEGLYDCNDEISDLCEKLTKKLKR